jgi:hypothetical protein
MHRRVHLIALSVLFVTAVGMPAHARGPRFQFDQDNVPGWTLMSSAERAAHHQKLLSFKTVEECQTYMAEHRKKMEARAKERNQTLRTPRVDVCEQMKAKGLLE